MKIGLSETLLSQVPVAGCKCLVLSPLVSVGSCGCL